MNVTGQTATAPQIALPRLAGQTTPGPQIPPRAKPADGGGGYPRPYSNERRNSRVEARLPHGDWRLKWQAPLPNLLGASFVLQQADRVLLPGTYQWVLFGLDGHEIRKDAMGGGEAVLDRSAALFYAPVPSGMITACHFEDGSRSFATAGYGDNHYSRSFIARRGRFLVNVSPGQLSRPHAAHTLIETGIQVQDIGERQPVDESGVLENATVQAQDTRSVLRLSAAMHNDSLVLAFKDRIQVLDLHLKVLSEFKEQFDPQSLSLDETGRIYILVQARNKPSLWVLTPQCQRIFSFDLLPAQAASPPIVGYDHRVFLTVGSVVVAVSPEGTRLWEHSQGGQVAGAVVTADDQLLVAAGERILSFDPQGAVNTLHSFPGEQLLTPAILTEGGEILVASAKDLYCLTAAAR